MFPSNSSLAEVEHVLIFNGVHLVRYIVADLRLQFTNQATEDPHFHNWKESRLFQTPAMAGNGSEVAVNAGKAAICSQLSFKMVSSQFAPPCRLVRAAFGEPNHRALPADYRLGVRVVCFLRCFWYRVFLPLAIFGRTSSSRFMSFSLHSRSRTPPAIVSFGAGTLPARMKRLRVDFPMPSFFATCSVESLCILGVCSQIGKKSR